MTHKELLDKFIIFENNFDLNEWQINSIPLWQIIRSQVFTSLYNQLIKKTVVKVEKDVNKRWFLVFNLLPNFILKNPFLAFKKRKILVLNHPRRKFNNGFYEDIYTDYILESLEKDYVVLEGFVNINNDHHKPVKTSNLYYLDFIQLTGSLYSLIPLCFGLSFADRAKIKIIEENIEKEFKCNVTNLDKEISKLIRRWNFTYPIVNKLLKKLDPKIILNVVSYSFINQVITFVAKTKGIPVLELQHGTVGKYHINYNYQKNQKLSTFPDYFLAWGNKWIENSRLPIPIENIKVVGFPYIDNFRKITNQIVRKRKQVVVISQLREDIAYFTNNLAEHLPGHEFIFKAHPAEYQFAVEKYSSILQSKNIRIVTNDKVSLYNIFQECSIVLGVYSTALIEALAFCPKVGIVKLSGWEYFEDLEESKNLIFIDNIEEALVFIGEEIGSLNSNVQNYFEVNSKDKILTVLDSMTAAHNL